MRRIYNLQSFNRLRTSFTIYNFTRIFLLVLILNYTLYILHSHVSAVSPTPTPKLTVVPTQKPGNVTPSLSASPSAQPTTTEDEKVKEIREAIKEKVNEIKDKIEKKAYVGDILEITDSTLTLTNFRGKQRVRLTEETTIIGESKKEIKAKDLAVEDKIIALGYVSENEILEAKRVIVVPKPKTSDPKRIFLFGTISEIDPKTSTVTLTLLKNLDQTQTLKIDKNTSLVSQADAKASLTVKDLKENQTVIAVYPETTDDKTPPAKSFFVLP